MIIARSSRFDKSYRKLSPDVREQFKIKIQLLVSSNFRHPSLRIKKIKGTGNIWEGSIDMNHRFTFEKTADGIFLRVIGPHKAVDKP